LIPVIDYRKRRFYHKDVNWCKSHENLEGKGIMIGHSQMGEIEIPKNVAIEIFANYLTENGFVVSECEWKSEQG
jgi:hypothetical protein